MQFTDDEIETIKSIISEHGCDCPGTDSDRVKELEYKLELAIRPTPEELAEEERKRKEFAETPMGKQMSEMFARLNERIAFDLLNQKETNLFMCGEQWNFDDLKIGTQLRIRLPHNYNVQSTQWQKFKKWWNNK